MIMNIIKANKGIVKKVLVLGGAAIGLAVVAMVAKSKTEAEEMVIDEDAEIIEAEVVEVETEQE
jgi:threonine dehydrogenase-like Zn-dependent dehydrogenase